MEIEKRNNYFREYYKSKNKSKSVPYETDEITKRLYEIQNMQKKRKAFLYKKYIIYFYYCLGYRHTDIRDLLDVTLNSVYDAVNNIESDSLVWRSEMYYIKKSIVEFANEYKAKI